MPCRLFSTQACSNPSFLLQSLAGKQLQSLAGKLNWAAGVVHGGSLPSAYHRCYMEVRLDIEWWKVFMTSFNGSSLMLDDRPVVSVSTDACNIGAGGYCCGGGRLGRILLRQIIGQGSFRLYLRPRPGQAR